MISPEPAPVVSTRTPFARVPAGDSPEARGERLRRFVSERGTVVLFKHSAGCFVSRRAKAQLEAFAASRPDVPVILVDVVDERALSRWIAEAWGIRHQSPQVFVFREGSIAWHGSHGHVEALRIQREAAPADEPGL